MQVFRTAAMAAGLSLYFLTMPAAAQIDYRNLDDDRPVASEDAYPVERYAFELLAPYRFEAEAGGAELHTTVPEAAYGFARNAQLGVKLPLAALDEATGTEWGLAGLKVFGLYNFNTESRTLPGISLRGDANFPVGSLAGEGTRFALKAIATRSWGRMRVHLNAARGFGSGDALSAVEPLPRWSASLAVDRTFFRSSFLLIGELATAQLIDNAPNEVTAGIGGRWQWTPTLVLDAGVTRRLSDSGPDLGLTVGVSHAFGIRALLPEGGSR
jgi:hypothetical protein